MSWLIPLFVIGYVVVSVIRAAVKAAQTPTPAAKARPSPANSDPATAERTRRVQEEIRRKIAERRGRLQPPPEFLSRSEPDAPSAMPPELPSTSTAAVLERQEKLAEQMRALESARLAERRRATALATVVREADRVAESAATARKELLDDLRGATTLRRVVLAREILGPPVSLR